MSLSFTGIIANEDGNVTSAGINGHMLMSSANDGSLAEIINTGHIESTLKVSQLPTYLIDASMGPFLEFKPSWLLGKLVSLDGRC